MPVYSAFNLAYAIIIDLAGNDSYSSTQNKGFASAVLGISLLVDTQGDDDYQGNTWAQGGAFAGIAALYDLAGDDHFESFCQSGLYQHS